MELNRREFIKTSAIAATATAAGVTVPGVQQALAQGSDDIRWDKAACRYCGNGCGELVGTRNGHIVAVQGDPDSPVNRGLNCIKGYFLAKIPYGRDRLTQPLLRKTNGVFDKNGTFEPVSWDEAFDIMEEKWKAALAEKGPRGVGMFASGQWTVWEGYAASKFMKAGLRSNNIDPNARHCMASAVVGFMRAFGSDEPMGVYDDLEHADTFVLWGSNMAEMHPILWSRLSDTRLTKPGCKVMVLSTYRHRSFELADEGMIFEPQSDLAILNYIANYIIENDAVNWDFVNQHVNFTVTDTDIGYGLRPDHPLEKKAKNPGSGKMTPVSFDEYAAAVKKYDLDYTSKLSGVPKDQLRKLAQEFADPNRKVMSLWTMGVNQHTRGSWVNGLIYNVHLLTGKISEPGNSPFSLTGQPSACGTAREVGTFAHRLPADMVVMNKDHRDFAEKVWDLPSGTVPDWVGYHAVLQSRMLKDGELKCYWTLCTNNMQAGPNVNDEMLPGWRNPETFIVVSDAYPTASAMAADLVLPAAMWVEKEGGYGNAERRMQFWRQQVKAPGEARSDLWQVVEFSKRFKTEEVWPEELLSQRPDLKGKTLFDVLFANEAIRRHGPEKITDMAGNEYENDEQDYYGFYLQKGLFNEYRRFSTEGPKIGHELGEFERYHQVRGMRWPVIDGKETLWRYREGYDPHVPAGAGVKFYGRPDGKANVIFAPYEPPAEAPDAEYDLWLCTGRVLEHWHTGTMTRRVPELHRAYPQALLYMNERDARARNLRRGMPAKVATRRGEVTATVETRGRNTMPEGSVFIAFFDEGRLVNRLTLDATCPLSRETDFKKNACKVARA